MHGVRQNFLSGFFFFAPSRIGAGDREGEGVGDGEGDKDGEGIGMELCKGGALCPGAPKTGDSGMPFNRLSSRSILSVSRCSLSTSRSVERRIYSLPSLPFYVSSSCSFQLLFLNFFLISDCFS